MTKTDKPKPFRKWSLIAILLLLIALLFCCCHKKPRVFTLNSYTYDINGKLVQVPFSKLIVENGNGEINAHGDVEMVPDGDVYLESKRRNLKKECFSKTDYSGDVANLSTIALTEDDITITVINLDDEGRLESYDLVDPNTGNLPSAITNAINTNPVLGNYEAIQIALSNMPRSSVTTSNANNDIRARAISSTYSEKTPFYKPFPANFAGGSNGHVIFYVLADENLQFNRSLPVISHVPAANIGRLYSPFFKYEIMPAQPSNKLEVQVLHFKRGGTMMEGMTPDAAGKMPCVYPYDLGVIAKGQDIGLQDTPLLIDPEVGPEGGLP